MVRVPDAAGQVRSAPVKALRGFFAGIGQLLVTADRFKADEARRERAQYEQDRERQDAERTPDAESAPEARSELEAQHPLPSPKPPRQEAANGEGDGQADVYEPLTAPRGPAAGRGDRDDRDGRDARAGRHRATGLQGPAASAQTPTRRFRSLDSTGNVRLLTADEAVGTAAEDAPAPYEPPPFHAGPSPAASPVPAPRPAVAPGSPAAARSTPAAAPSTPAAAPSTPAAAPSTPAAAPSTPAAPAAPPAVPVRPADLPVPGYDQLTLASLRSRLRYLDAAQLRVLAEYEKATANRADVVGMFERRIAKLQAAATHAT